MNSKGLAIGLDTALYPLHVSLGEYNSALTKRFILATSNGISSTTVDVLVCANLLMFLCVPNTTVDFLVCATKIGKFFSGSHTYGVLLVPYVSSDGLISQLVSALRLYQKQFQLKKGR